MTRRTPAGDTFSHSILQIFRVYGFLQDSGDRITKPSGQTAARWKVLGAVPVSGALRSVADIARGMGMARQSVQRIADEVVKDGLAVYVDNPDHQRAKLLQLTTKGLKALRIIWEGQKKWANRVSAQLDHKELKQLSAILEKLQKALEKDEILKKK